MVFAKMSVMQAVVARWCLTCKRWKNTKTSFPLTRLGFKLTMASFCFSPMRADACLSVKTTNAKFIPIDRRYVVILALPRPKIPF